MTDRKRILFVCAANSCRSQMAEGIANHLYGDTVEAYSAGSRPTFVNPLAIKAMAEIGIDILRQRSKSVNEFAGQGFDYVITLCDDYAEGSCPVFPGEVGERLHWDLPDPAEAQGTEYEVLPAFREVRDQIKARFNTLVEVLT